jgi:hypothetical protein
MASNAQSGAFYKFRPYDADPASISRGWVRETLFDNRIRFAKMSELNDLSEGRPLLVPRHKDPATQAAAVYASVLDDAHREGLTGEAAERQARFETAAIVSTRVPREIYQRLFVEAINENFWVYSVCATRQPTLMWAHYADGHKGIALHFDPRVPPFNRISPVHYTDQYPEYPFPGSEPIASSEAARAMLYTKATRWDYEEEYRVVRIVDAGTAEERVARRLGLAWDGQFATLPGNALVGVTLGAAMPDAVVSDLSAEIAARRPSLEVWRATIRTGTYEFDFQRIR